MRYSIFSILRVTAYCAVGIAVLNWVWRSESQPIMALALMLVPFAFLGLLLLPMVFVPMAILFAAQNGTQLDPKSVPGVVFLFRVWLCALAVTLLFALIVIFGLLF